MRCPVRLLHLRFTSSAGDIVFNGDVDEIYDRFVKIGMRRARRARALLVHPVFSFFFLCTGGERPKRLLNRRLYPQPPSVTPQPPSVTPQPPLATPQPPSVTPQPPSVTPQPPLATPQPPSVTPQPPSVTLQLPSVTLHPPSATVAYDWVWSLLFRFRV